MPKPENDKSVYSQPAPIRSESALQQPIQKKMDALTIIMAFLATLAVAGLIPFWIYIYFNIPGR